MGLILAVFLSVIQIPVMKADAATAFTFNGSMGKEVLRSYASRAVTLQGLCVEGVNPDPIFEEDLRMIRRTGAKYIGRAAFYSWSGNMSKAQIDEHFTIAKDRAAKVHKADPEIILQAGIFEIAYRATVNNTPVPDWVFKAFSQPVVSRNFKYADVVFADGYKDPGGKLLGNGAWGNNDSAWPNIDSLEAQMYFYYLICRYIDAGFESIHIGQYIGMMGYINENNPVSWDKVLTMARTYAKTHARRKVVLFDGHSTHSTAGLKLGERLILDIQAAPIAPSETVNLNNALQCEVRAPENGVGYTWVGRSKGGKHPLGFDIENLITILELDNYGINNNPGVATPNAPFSWGYDDICWFALQPEWYRNQFLKEADTYLKTHVLDSTGRQVYFLQPAMRRTIVVDVATTYKPGSSYNADFVFYYCEKERSAFEFDTATKAFKLSTRSYYRANRQGDGCPNGANQENTIREIFLGKNVAENPELLKVVLPPAYTGSTTSLPASNITTSSRADGATSSKTTGTNNSGDNQTINSDITDVGSVYDTENSDDMVEPDNSESARGTVDSEKASSAPKADKGSALPWIFAGVGVLVLLGGGFAFWFFRMRKNAAQ